MRVLIVEDSETLRESLRLGLSREGFAVDVAGDGSLGLSTARNNPYDVLVLDLMLPKLDGLSVLAGLREKKDRPHVLVLTARCGVDDRVQGLDAGADDYLVKPFALDELLARVRALLRRAMPGADGGPLRFVDIELDPVAHEVRRGERPIALTRTEFLLLELFLRHPRQVLTRSLIFENVWGYDFGPSSNSLEVYMGYLRRKTEAAGEPRLLHTVRGVGYVLREP